MKRLCYCILYLNIYILISFTLKGQSVYLEIQSERNLKTSFLDSLQSPQKFENYIALEKATEQLYEQFQKIGFIEVERKSIQKKNDSTYLATFNLGNQWKKIEVQFEPFSIDKKLLASISREITDSTFTIPLQDLASSLLKINSWKATRGDPFATTSLSQIRKRDSLVLHANLNQTNAPARTLDGIVVKGYDKFPVSYLKHYAGIKKNKLLNLEKIKEQNDLLDNLGFVRTLKPPEALFKKDSTIVYLYLEKTNHNLFDGILGFATDEETQNIQFNGYLNLELNNNLNFGEQLILNYKADGNEQQNFRTRLTLPYIAKSPFGVSGELSLFRRDTTFSTTEQIAKLLYQPSPKIQTHIGYKSFESNNLQDNILAGNTVLDLNSNFFLGGISYTQQQRSKLFPIQTQISIRGEFGSRSLPEVSDDQTRFVFSGKHQFNLNNRNAIYINNDTQFLSSDTYVTNELYRFGGINSIRGFNENSIDASLFSVLNTEYRFLLNADSYIHSIIDLGFFENEVQNTSEELYSFGIGLGLNTKAGLLRLNIANGNTREGSFQFNNTQVHVSLSAQF